MPSGARPPGGPAPGGRSRRSGTAASKPRPIARPGSGKPQPPAAHAHPLKSGQRSQRGRPATQTVDPTSSIAWLWAQPRPAGTSASAAACTSRAFRGRPACRASTRPTFVSTIADIPLIGERQHRPGGVGPDPGKRQEAGQIVGEAPAPEVRHGLGTAPEVERPAVVTQSRPLLDDRGRAGVPTRNHGREASEEAMPTGHDPVDLGLLQHHLADQHRPRVARRPPRQVASVLLEPRGAGRPRP